MGDSLNVTIRAAQRADCAELARLRAALWPDASTDEHEREIAHILDGPVPQGFPAVTFVAEASGRTLVGFLEAGLRSHADGCDASQAVGYIEGWYVAEDARLKGVGRKLLAAAEDWARRQGCGEMASDALFDNDASQRAHEALGYSVVDRCVHYRKAL